MKPKTRIIDLRRIKSRKAVEKANVTRAQELKEIQERTKAFVKERFPNAKSEPIMDDDGNVIAQLQTFDVDEDDQYTLMELMRIQYPNMPASFYVQTVNGVFQKKPFDPTERAKAAPAAMRERWTELFATCPPARMRGRIEAMREKLLEIGFYTLIDLSFYGYPSQFPEVEEYEQACAQSTIINTFLNALVHVTDVTDAELVSVRDYITAYLKGEVPVPYKHEYLWFEGDKKGLLAMRAEMEVTHKYNPYMLEGIHANTYLLPEGLRAMPEVLHKWIAITFSSLETRDD